MFLFVVRLQGVSESGLRESDVVTVDVAGGLEEENPTIVNLRLVNTVDTSKLDTNIGGIEEDTADSASSSDAMKLNLIPGWCVLVSWQAGLSWC